MLETQNSSQPIIKTIDQTLERTAHKAERALDSTRQGANQALDAAQQGVEDLRGNVASGLSHGISQVESLAREGIERARQKTAQMRDQVDRASAQTVSYIQNEPLKSVLIAAATGAITAVLVNWLRGSSSSNRRF
jgi:ElaB/YqjD/DUF883 family membrane-anchored ribosome-binding protein